MGIQNTKFLGSSSVKTSVANAEILPQAPANWTVDNYRLNKFSIMNYSDCTLIVNGVELFLKANQGFNSNIEDPRIESVKIKESGIEYNWIGAY